MIPCNLVELIPRLACLTLDCGRGVTDCSGLQVLSLTLDPSPRTTRSFLPTSLRGKGSYFSPEFVLIPPDPSPTWEETRSTVCTSFRLKSQRHPPRPSTQPLYVDRTALILVDPHVD